MGYKVGGGVRSGEKWKKWKVGIKVPIKEGFGKIDCTCHLIKILNCDFFTLYIWIKKG